MLYTQQQHASIGPSRPKENEQISTDSIGLCLASVYLRADVR